MTNQRLSENQRRTFFSLLSILGYFIIWVKLGYFGVFYHCSLGIFQLCQIIDFIITQSRM